MTSSHYRRAGAKEPELYEAVSAARLKTRILAEGIAAGLKNWHDADEVLAVLAYCPALEEDAQALLEAEIRYYGAFPDATTRLERQLSLRTATRKKTKP